MKINQNSIASNVDSVAAPETESQKPAQSNPAPQARELHDAGVSKTGQQQLANDARSFSSLNANLIQASLLNQVPTRNQMLQDAAQTLKPALPQMLSKSGNDPDRFMSAVDEQLKSSGDLTYKNLGSLAEGDIMAMAFIVMMESSKSAREDLKSIMDGVKSINEQKQSMREILERLNPDSTRTADDDDD